MTITARRQDGHDKHGMRKAHGSAAPRADGSDAQPAATSRAITRSTMAASAMTAANTTPCMKYDRREGAVKYQSFVAVATPKVPIPVPTRERCKPAQIVRAGTVSLDHGRDELAADRMRGAALLTLLTL